MQTVEIQCGSCNQIMGVGLENLGAQVHCPHCQAVVQVPDASAFGIAPPAPPPMPAMAPPPPQFAPAPPPMPNFAPPPQHHDPFGGVEHDDPHDVPSVPIRSRKPSMVVPTIMVFLIPYSLVSTGLVVWLFYSGQRKVGADPLLSALDNPAAGRIAHDSELPPHLKATIGQTLTVGDLEVTPLKVTQNGLGTALRMHLKTKNVGSVPLSPISENFCQLLPKQGGMRPYCYIEPNSKDVRDRIYGFLPIWYQPDGDQRDTSPLPPGQEMLLVLQTIQTQEETLKTRRLIANGGDCVWRIQLRRGLVSTAAGPKSATAVIGIPFNPRNAPKE